MNESEKRGTVGEAIFVIFFIFLILLFLLYKFGTNQTSVSNLENNEATLTGEELLNQLSESETDNEIYNKYIKQIYEAQTSNNSEQVDEIITNYERELKEKVDVPKPYITLQNVSDKYNPKLYRDNFELLFADLKKTGATTESQLLLAQIVDGETLLPLSDYDRESILRIATEYEIFVDKLTNLSTPTSLENKVTEIANSATNVSYILKKLVDENDKKIYTLWISKYVENMSVIITGRYGLQ